MDIFQMLENPADGHMDEKFPLAQSLFQGTGISMQTLRFPDN